MTLPGQTHKYKKIQISHNPSERIGAAIIQTNTNLSKKNKNRVIQILASQIVVTSSVILSNTFLIFENQRISGSGKQS